MKRKMDVESALRWAYRDELPKVRAWDSSAFLAARSGWAAIESYVDLLTKIDPNRYGLISDVGALSLPDPDAIAIGEAVRDLDAFELEVPADWNPIADLGDLGPLGDAVIAKALAAETVQDRAGARRFKFKPSWLILRHALQLGAPDWEIEPTQRDFVRGAGGGAVWFRLVREHELDGRGDPIPDCFREIERADGWSPKTRRPISCAYRKEILSPDPHHGVVERMRYEVWRSALDFLCDELSNKLDRLEVTRSTRARRPWEGGHESPVIWRNRAAPPPRPIGKTSVLTARPLTSRDKLPSQRQAARRA